MSNSNATVTKTCLLLSVAFVVVGTIGYFSLNRDAWVFYALAHLGALGVMGLFGSAAGFLAGKKSRSYWTAFLLGSLLPIVAGITAVFAFWIPEGGHLYCGGVVCLAVGIVVVVTYSLVMKKQPTETSGALSGQSK